jgi:hypothetical protein
VRHAQALLVQARQSAACNASHSVESRLSRLLSRARDLCGSEAFDGQAFDSQALPLTQELLAQMIGVRRNAVSIVAHAFQQAGLVNYSRGQIEIRDIDGLRWTSCECHAAVRTQCDRLLNVTDWRNCHIPGDRADSHHMRLFVNSSCQRSMARSFCIFDCIFCIF